MTPARARRVLGLAGLLIAGQLLLRAWVAFQADFYFDDLILIGRAGSLPLLSTEHLLYDHYGHLMPGAFLLAGVLTHVAPLQWWLPALSLIVLQALASLAVLRLLVVLLGARWALVAPLLLYLFSPLTLPAYAWWAAALNSLPLQAALAWVAADAVQLVRSGRRRYAISGVVVFVLALSFFAKAVVVPWVGVAVAALLLHVGGEKRAWRAALRRTAPLWVPASVLTVAWAVLYRNAIESPADQTGGTLPQALDLFWRGVELSLLPALLGGPWSWDRLGQSTPFTAPSAGLAALAMVVAAATLVWTLVCRRRTGWIWVFAGTYVAMSLGLMVMGRLSDNTSPHLPQSLRYLADSTVVIVTAMALLLRAPTRRSRETESRPTWLARPVVASCAVAFLAGSVWSTVSFTRHLSYPTASYLATAQSSLLQDPSVPLLDQPVPEVVLWSEAHPHNRAAQVFSALGASARFAQSTPQLRMLDDTGHLVAGRVADPARSVPGPDGDCGYVIRDGPSELPIESAKFVWEWTVQLNYLADRDGSVRVSLGSGAPVDAPITAGLGEVFVRVTGGGDVLRVAPATPGLRLCVSGAAVGRATPEKAS